MNDEVKILFKYLIRCLNAFKIIIGDFNYSFSILKLFN